MIKTICDKPAGTETNSLAVKMWYKYGYSNDTVIYSKYTVAVL